MTIFAIGMGCIAGYLLLCLADLLICIAIEKAIYLYPCTEFLCVCGYRVSLMEAYQPVQLYHLFLVRQHTKRCLPWIMEVQMNGITPYCAQLMIRSSAELSSLAAMPAMPRAALIERYKKMSDNHREGKNFYEGLC